MVNVQIRKVQANQCYIHHQRIGAVLTLYGAAGGEGKKYAGRQGSCMKRRRFDSVFLNVTEF